MENRIKRLITIIRYSFLLLLILFTTIIVIDAHVKNSAEDRIISADESVSLNADCIIVLGAGVRADGTPSPMLKDRLLQGIALYDLGASDRLLMSGDNTKKGYDEVNTMKQYAIDKSENIFMDHAGISTYDSIYRAKEIFQVEKIIVVTQEYHLYRALYISDSLGVDAYGVSAAPTIYAGQELREIREIIARAKDFVKCIIKPPASILGEVIPVSGDGNVTNDRSIVEYEGDV
jgi:vancomycin permeability regulator SanA